MLKKKIIVVIGGSGLLGKKFVQAILLNGGTPIIADIGIGAVTESLDSIDAKGEGFSKAISINVDITSSQSLDELLSKVKSICGKIDAVVNCAYPKNKNFGKHFFDVSYEDFCINTNDHLGGYFLVCQKFSKFFIEQGYGNIVNFGSIYGVIPPKFEIYSGTNMTVPIEYAMSKVGIVHMTKYLAKYLKGKNVRINSISPGGIFDDQNQLFLRAYKNNCINKGMLASEDINGTLLFLLSDFSLNINGQNIVVDDGFTL